MPNNVLLTQIVVCKQHWYFCSLDCDVFIRIAKNPKSKLSANANYDIYVNMELQNTSHEKCLHQSFEGSLAKSKS